jgi:hypothetical protein
VTKNTLRSYLRRPFKVGAELSFERLDRRGRCDAVITTEGLFQVDAAP